MNQKLNYLIFFKQLIMSTLLKVSLRQNALFIPAKNWETNDYSQSAYLLVANLAKLGYGVSEELLAALKATPPQYQAKILATFRDIMGVQKNWTPLVKGWDMPTGESVVDHIVTFFANAFQMKNSGVQLQCGHIIPNGTFPLERYNGCPFCGTPFEVSLLVHYSQGSKKKFLELWTEADATAALTDLLASKTALDATQIDSLNILLSELPLPTDVKIEMKETLMAVIDGLSASNNADKAQAFFTSPTDILRYLWFKKTGFLQIYAPKTIVKRHAKNNRHKARGLSDSAYAKLEKMQELKLKYSRKDCAIVANWLNKMPMTAEKMGEIMHPKRGMWVRFIRALRLAEYSQRAGFEHLKELMDVFYNSRYDVWAGSVNHFRMRSDVDNTMRLLQQRPGLFARSLFANMLWFGPDATVAAFGEVIDAVPARLVFTLNMYAENYFDKTVNRTVKPLGGVAKVIPANKLLHVYDDAQLATMRGQVEDLCLLAMQKRFAATKTESKTLFIDPQLFKMPVSIGDRSETVQDMPSALMGTRFPIEGDKVRLFMQWGVGLPAQHLDMDLSCHIAFADGKTEICSYSYLTATGSKHSGDIINIPEKVGTAEYIDLNVNELRKAKAKYVTFTCNAYSNGSLTPNLVVGWMNSKFPMRISEKTGVAYDPSCVQHQVRIVQNVAKGLVFGVLDVEAREIVWLEMPFQGQVVQNLNSKGVEALLKKLDAKLSIGNLLVIKAEAQNLARVETAEEADEVYSIEWAKNTAAVTQLLVD
jgi:hypothetical protein